MANAFADNNEYREIHVGHEKCNSRARPLIQVFNHPKVDCAELDELKSYQQRHAFVVIFDTSKRAVLICPPQSPAGLTGILRNPEESSGILRTPAGLHYDFADLEF
jgi:hypothetical protein